MAVFETSTPEEVTFDTLVGEGKKFKTSDDLARAKAESDRVILARERELAELRAELDRRATVEDVVNRIQTNITPPQSQRPASEESPPAAAPVFTEEDLDKRVKSVIEQTNVEARKTSNIEAVANELVRVYGTEEKANQAVAAKAQELGVSVQWLMDIAAQGLKPFSGVFGLTTTAPTQTPTSRGDVNTEGFASTRPGQVQPGTYAYYQQLHREKGDKFYFSPEVQNQLMKDAFAAEKEGRDFFKS